LTRLFPAFDYPAIFFLLKNIKHMLNLDILRIPKDDDFEDEPEDELASAGFRVVEGDDEEAAEAEESVEAELGAVENPLVVDEDDKDDGAEIKDGLDELEELEKGYANIPLGYEEEEE
jgi:hypothetical protein